MLAETVLAAFSAAALLYKGQQIYGRGFERRTARLERTQRAFYDAADALLKNPELDAGHLRYVKIAARHVAGGNKARLHLRIIKKVIREPITPAEKQAFAAVPAPLRRDLEIFVRAMLLAIAERQPLWKGSLKRALAKADRQIERSPERTAVALEAAFDDRLIVA